MRTIKLSISLPKPAKQHAERQARRIQRERGAARPNISEYVAQLVMRDRQADLAEQREAA